MGGDGGRCQTISVDIAFNMEYNFISASAQKSSM